MTGGSDDTMSVLERKPDVVERFQDTDTDDYIEKCNTYEAEYARRLKAKYFSKKNLYGGSIFDKDVTIDNETIRSSRWHCTHSFTDPVQSFEEQCKSSPSAAETSTNPSSRKNPCKRSSS